jgi:hypothetical protein
MAPSAEAGFLVIADLTGYTAYLSRSEIEHAPTIAGDLLETIIGRLEPPLRLAKLEGDAAFLYAEDGLADPSLLMRALKASYVAFRRRLRSIERATSCSCIACGLAPRLDLKLVVHHGPFVRTVISGRDELAGSSVIVAHRLLKGTTVATARTPGFALFTREAIDALRLDAVALGLVESHEAIEHLGDVSTFILDLEQIWTAERGQRRLSGTTGRSVLDLTIGLETDPATAWEYLTAPSLRPLWEGPIVIEEVLAGGQRGVGTTSQCVTGRLATLEEIVDWQPSDHAGWRLAVPEIGPVEATLDLAQVEDATRVHLRWSVPSEMSMDPLVVEGLVAAKALALQRLARLFQRTLAVANSTEASK